jgi:hypothetical protein
MKTGNKRFIALLCAVLILVGLVGCGAEKELAPVKIERVHQAVFRDNFEQFLVPIADDYTITELPPVELDDGTQYRAISLKEDIVDNQYYLRMYYDADGLLEMVLVDGNKKSGANFSFAILSLYAYKAMGFEATDADVFYEEFALLTPDPSGFKEVAPGVVTHASTIDDLLTFAISYNTENAPE